MLGIATPSPRRGYRRVNPLRRTEFLPPHLAVLAQNVGDVMGLIKSSLFFIKLWVVGTVGGELDQSSLTRHGRLYARERDRLRVGTEFRAASADVGFKCFAVFGPRDQMLLIFVERCFPRPLK